VKSEVRVGRLRGSGATMNLTTATQVVGGLSTTLDIPKGHAALVSFASIVTPNNSYAYAVLEVDGVQQGPFTATGANVQQSLSFAQAWLVPPGRHALRVLVYSTSAAGTLDPTQATLSWVIAPQGGIAN
jgi:hypothetical protein